MDRSVYAAKLHPAGSVLGCVGERHPACLTAFHEVLATKTLAHLREAISVAFFS
jgi:hypothetical protein